MDKDKINIQYLGNNSIIFYSKGFSGIVNKKDIITVSKKTYEKELKSNPLWKEVIPNKKKDKEKYDK